MRGGARSLRIGPSNAVTAFVWADALRAADSPNVIKYDAMQHALWSALNARDIGPGAARKFGDAHELSSNHPGDTCMDLRNNSFGYQLAANSGYLSDDSYKTLVTEMADAGRLQIGRCGFYE